MGRVLYGYYHVPDRSSKPIDFIINPEGMELRSRKRCGCAAGSVTKHLAACQATSDETVRLYGMLHAYRAFHVAGELANAGSAHSSLVKPSHGNFPDSLCLQVHVLVNVHPTVLCNQVLGLNETWNH